tara:strand:+ start:438 stop:806 length:369 start_codon:yes stop_codon:yes gene_type:complete
MPYHEMEEIVVTGKRGGRRGDPRSFIPEMPEDSIGLNADSLLSQVKYTAWDLFRDGMDSYLSGKDYSTEQFKDFFTDRSFTLPVDLPGDYSVNFDFNKPNPLYQDLGVHTRDDYRVTFKRDF